MSAGIYGLTRRQRIDKRNSMSIAKNVSQTFAFQVFSPTETQRAAIGIDCLLDSGV